MGKLLDKIQGPKDLKALQVEQLGNLSREIRKYLVEVVSEGGGHLSSNLGVVELTIALHYCFHSPVDKIIWDVGHQSYVHKILTGRKDALKTIRRLDGISGFPKTEESPHDAYNTGHSSTSISAALGFASARDLLNQKNYVIPIIGDGALTGGLAFEALNNAANLKSNFIVILNDNQMSISENVGGISLYLDSIRTASFYNEVKEDVQKVLRKIPKYGEGVINAVRDVKDSVKQLFIPGMFFEEMGFTYLGPIDGHNIKQVITTLNQAKKVDGPTLIHVNTVKGKGYKYAEAFPSKFHGTRPFIKESGDVKSESKGKSFSKTFGAALLDLAKDNSKIVAITAAMPEGTGLDEFAVKYPQRFFDVGIAEQHGVTFAGGLAMSGLKPFIAIYSSFLQRAYDQILHDICLQKLPVVFCVDRSGIVGEDGETHQGIFDTSFLGHIPNMTIMAPKNSVELVEMINLSALYYDGPISIKYPRGIDALEHFEDTVPVLFGKSETIYKGNQIGIISVGTMCKQALDVCDKLLEKGYSPTLVNARFIKPVDKECILELANNHEVLVVIEENVISGGYGVEVLQVASGVCRVLLCGIEDTFVTHGSRDELLDQCGLSSEKLYDRIIDYIKDIK
ncbi:MAG: 1-deoxy-D-xylulose-5-phosphate synthase [Firmicutes bacterium HGW-Firmicutes-1]|jgi:1-deoxy-D-xylulose-5-phosphate synthase|nr:MAG: 1-deoxy-D-xylulose-5-phosphate synthase [Firmicutes bacterium HGW-Firmicutes-1]